MISFCPLEVEAQGLRHTAVNLGRFYLHVSHQAFPAECH